MIKILCLFLFAVGALAHGGKHGGKPPKHGGEGHHHGGEPHNPGPIIPIEPIPIDLPIGNAIKKFYPWALNNDDQRMDLVSSVIHVHGKYVVGKHSEKELYLHSSGAISFGKDHASVPTADDSICGPKNVSFRGVAPFLAVTQQVSDSTVFFRETKDSGLLQRAESEIVTAYPIFEGLKLERLFIATWYKLRPSKDSACSNTFQTILATDNTFTFAIVNYADMEWPGEKICTDTPKSVRVGYDNREHGHGRRYEESLSCQSNVTLVRTSSNVNLPGTYIYRLDNAGLNYLDNVYYYVKDLWSLWVWSSLFLSFSFGMLFSLCCVACCSCCCGAKSKRSKSARSDRRYRRFDVRPSPPIYSVYPDDIIPPKY